MTICDVISLLKATQLFGRHVEPTTASRYGVYLLSKTLGEETRSSADIKPTNLHPNRRWLKHATIANGNQPATTKPAEQCKD